MTMNIIQIIEDEPLHAQLLDHTLRQARYRTNVAMDGTTGLADVMRLNPSVVLLDLMLPGLNGQDVCRRIRSAQETSHIPIIMISALGSEEDRIAGMEMGADDYVKKPFSPREILCRVQAVLRRSEAGWASTSGGTGSPVTIREHSLVISLFGKDLTVSPKEILLLRLLTARSNEVVPEEELVGALWNTSPLLHEQELLRAIWGLRRKLENNSAGSIEILPSIGYRFIQHMP